MVASEAAPFIKTGGLADVIGCLPPELRERGEDVAVVIPWYSEAKVEEAQGVLQDLPIWLGPARYPVSVHVSMLRGVPYYLVKCPPLFDREGVYFGADGDFTDNHIRFSVLARSAVAVARWVFRPQILHCHDWQAALVPVLVRGMLVGDPTFMGVKTLLTIHNLGYQGIFSAAEFGQMGLERSLLHPGALEFFGDVNLLKGGIVYSDALSTVSKTYAAEIQTPEYGCRLDGLLRLRGGVLTGILNGVDYSEWNPEADPFIAARYSFPDLSGKLACKRDLLTRVGLPPQAVERPLVGIVSRFASQKGFDLLAEVAAELAAEELTLVALGKGEASYENLFRELAAAHPEKVAVKVGYDNPLAHQIEAGSDMFLMPSRYEPCGLNQIYSLRYGTVPVVRATGGLDDTIDESTGFKFKAYSGAALLSALRSALAVYRSKVAWRRLMANGMAKDFSWRHAAAEYSSLYERLALESRASVQSSKTVSGETRWQA